MWSRCWCPSGVVARGRGGARQPGRSQDAGASLLYLPPYSPEPDRSLQAQNDEAFAKLKVLLGKVVARTKEVLCTTIGELLDRFPAEECTNYLSNSG
jgi:hypothetical protein